MGTIDCSRLWLCLTSVSGSSLLALASGTAFAQAPAPDQGVTVPDIVVTAQRRAEKLEDVPITITSVSGEMLQSNNINTVTQIARAVPALRFDFAGAAAQPTIRGVGSALSGPGLYSNVSTYVDGFYMPSPSSLDFQFMSIQSVDVLKGPQGTLFGRNATGGAILVTTAKPSFTPTMTARASYSRWNTFNGGVYGSTGLGDKIAIDFAGIYERSDGWLHNIVTGKRDGDYERYGLRSKLLFEPSDAVRFTLAFTHNHVRDGKVRAYNAYQGLSIGTTVPGTVIAQDRGDVSYNGKVDFLLKTYAYQLTSEFDLGFADLKSYTMGRRETGENNLDRDGLFLPYLYSNSQTKYNTFTEELNLSSKPGGPLSWVAGLFFMKDNNYFPYLKSSTNGGPLVNTPNYGVKTKSYAAFLDATYELTDGLFLTAGGRYSEEKPDAFFGTAAGGRVEYTDKFKRFTPRVVLRFEPAPNSSIYASWSNGFKAGVLNPSSFTTVSLRPEKINAYEIGYKMASGGIRFDVSAFYYDYKDLQVATFNGVSALVRNAANSRIYGGEVQFSGKLTQALSINLGAAYTNAKYKDFLNAPYFEQNLNPASSTYGRFLNRDGDASGLAMQRAPKFTATANINYDIPLSSGRITLNANGFYTSTVYFDPTHQFKQDPYAIIGLRATWTSDNDHFSLGVFGDNVTDAKYHNQVLGGPYSIQSTWGDPATYGVTATIRY